MKREYAKKLRQLIEKAAAELSDADAADAPELSEAWAAGKEYPAGKRLHYGDQLYKVRQAHTSQADWMPDVTASLYERIPKPGEGEDPKKPIPYNGNMKIEKGKYYVQRDVEYVGTRDSGNPVYNDLKDLVGLYVEVYVGEA